MAKDAVVLAFASQQNFRPISPPACCSNQHHEHAGRRSILTMSDHCSGGVRDPLKGSSYLCYLPLCHLRIDRKRQHFRGRGLGAREVPRSIAEIAMGLLEVDRDGIMKPRLDTSREQPPLNIITVKCPHR